MKQMKRAVLNEVFSQKPEKSVYHYTTQSGLLGIIKSRRIWATHTQYLNDRREFRHALDLVAKEIDVLMTVEKRERKNVLKAMAKGLRSNPESVNVCVCSFSEDSDSLSQWRAYGGGASGFAIGLPGDFLATLVEEKKWYLARCIYDPIVQNELIRCLIGEVIEEVEEKVEKREEGYFNMPSWGGNFVPYLLQYAPILKDPSFIEEREWRVISRPLSCSSESFDFRQGSSLLIPYYKLPLFSTDLKFRVQEIVVGPTPDPELSTRSVTSLLVSQGLTNIPVRVSRVPFRNW